MDAARIFMPDYDFCPARNSAHAMPDLQSLFVILVILILAYLIVDGWTTRAVWVKGKREGLVSFRQWAHKRERNAEPWPYWFAMSFYAVAILCLCALLLIE